MDVVIFLKFLFYLFRVFVLSLLIMVFICDVFKWNFFFS